MNHYGTSRTYCTGIYDNQNNRELQNSNQVIIELNNLHEENLALKRADTITDLETQISRLKYENELLKDELEQCRAVIDKKWSEYLKKKEVIE